ncbi:helix-turn-helix transcriptional regulator [Actinomycetospora flava]|uniref:AraC family transcriptional regulator n=1 Tax=Actinomycetospora flava TaxID=3129232 RepID=A0ABU8MDZ2_9PSEU
MTVSHGAVQRHRVTTTDPEEAVEYQQAYARFRAGPVRREGFEFVLETASIGSMSVGHMRHAARMEAQAEPTAALVAVEVLAGRVHVRDDRGNEAATDVVLAPHWARHAARWAGYLRLTTLDPAEVARVGAERSGLAPPDVRFDTMTPLSAGHGRYWTRLVDHVDRDLLAYDDLMALPLLRQEAAHRLIAGALVVFPNSTLGARPGGQDSGEPATVRRAMAYIDAHADEDITVTEVADAARMGPRGLQAAFRRHRGETPLAYLRQVRMERAHHHLLAADPADGVTVGDVAARWGFSNAGRFSAAYRQAYGCSPRETLNR